MYYYWHYQRYAKDFIPNVKIVDDFNQMIFDPIFMPEWSWNGEIRVVEN